MFRHTDGAVGEKTEPDQVCVQNIAPGEHFAMGTVVMRTQDKFAVDGKRLSADPLCGRGPFSCLFHEVGFHADRGEGRGEALLTLNRLFANIERPSTDTMGLESD